MLGPPLLRFGCGPRAEIERCELGFERLRGRRSCARIFRQAAEDERFERRRDRLERPFARGDDGRVEMVAANLDDRLAAEDRLAGEYEVRDRAEGVDVRARIHRIGRQDALRRQVERRSDDLAVERDVAVVRTIDLPRKPEVEDRRGPPSSLVAR